MAELSAESPEEISSPAYDNDKFRVTRDGFLRDRLVCFLKIV